MIKIRKAVLLSNWTLDIQELHAIIKIHKNHKSDSFEIYNKWIETPKSCVTINLLVETHILYQHFQKDTYNK